MNNKQEKIDEYNKIKNEVLSKFRKELVDDLYNYDPTFHAIIEYLIRDVNPYRVIEELVLDRKRLYDEYHKQNINNKFIKYQKNAK